MRHFASLLLVTLVSSTVHAESELEAGLKIAKMGNGKGAVACQACHGVNGEGQMAAGFPALAGLPKAFLVKQMNDFKANRRQNPVMKPMALMLSADEVNAVAAYYASLKPTWIKAKLSSKNELGQEIAERGKWSQGVASCFSCHGLGALGVGPDFPALAGQSRQYLLQQLRDWKSGTRSNDELSLMKSVVKGLTDRELEAVASYLAGEVKTIQLPKDFHKVTKGFQAPDERSLKPGQFRDMVLRGRDIFLDTPKHAGKYMGNKLRCVNCHLDSGRLIDSAPLWAAYPMYPAYRKKNDKVNTLRERVQGCFKYSLNGKQPPFDGDIVTSLVAYQYWLAKGAPTGKAQPGRGYPKLNRPAKEPDYKRGETVYKKNCALCHGGNGQGQLQVSGWAFPPLWGSGSYNWGAGMHRVNTAAGFIKANMPLGKPNSLTDQQAWDVALYTNSHERPEDPRKGWSRSKTQKRFHQHECRYNK